jgi:hypothetical protein
MNSVDNLNVALRPLLDHIACGLALNYVEEMEDLTSSDAPEEDRGEQ